MLLALFAALELFASAESSITGLDGSGSPGGRIAIRRRTAAARRSAAVGPRTAGGVAFAGDVIDVTASVDDHLDRKDRRLLLFFSDFVQGLGHQRLRQFLRINVVILTHFLRKSIELKRKKHFFYLILVHSFKLITLITRFF